MNLQGRSVYLRYCEEKDVLRLFEWRNDVDFMKNCSVRRDKINLDDFKKELSDDFERDRHAQMMIVRKANEEPIGTIYSYGYKKVDGYIFITTFLSKKCRANGYGPEAFALFAKHLFGELSLYKIYMEVYEYNNSSLSCARGAGFTQEGCFGGHRLFNGERYDLLRYAIYKERDLHKIESFLRRLNRNI